MATKKTNIKALLQKAAVEALKKVVEFLILAVLVGTVAKYLFAAIPAVAASSIVAEVANRKMQW